LPAPIWYMTDTIMMFLVGCRSIQWQSVRSLSRISNVVSPLRSIPRLMQVVLSDRPASRRTGRGDFLDRQPLRRFDLLVLVVERLIAPQRRSGGAR